MLARLRRIASGEPSTLKKPFAREGKRLENIEAMLAVLVEQHQAREWYSVDQFAAIVDRSEFTCREWCRLGRVKAEKKRSGRGAHAAWAISLQELQRYQREGLLRGR